MKYKLIALDLDGTLLRTHHSITRKNYQALKNFANAGGKIVISTGRAITSARKIANKIEKYTGIQIPYIIALCGSMIYDHENKIIYQKLIKPETTKKIVDLIKKLKLNIWIYQKNFESDGVYSKSLIFAIVAKIAKHINLKKLNFAKTKIPARKINVFSFNLIKQKKFERIVNKELSDEVSLHKTNSLIYELSPAGCSKGEAIKIIANKLNIPLNQVASIGDSGNDLSAAEVSKCFGAIGRNKSIRNYSSENYPKLNSQVAKFINKRLLSKSPKIKLIVSDLDGTILNDKKLIDTNLSNNIKKIIQDEEIMLTFASGRSVHDIYRIINQSNLENANIRYVISNNGAIIYDLKKQKALKCSVISKKVANQLFKIITSLTSNNGIGKFTCYITTYDKKDTKNTIIKGVKYLPNIFVYTPNYQNVKSIKNFSNSEEISKSFKIIPTNSLPKKSKIVRFLIFCAGTEQRDKIISIIKDSHLNLNISTSSPTNIEINALYVSKGNALKKLAKILKIKNTELLTVGDQKNDITMLKLTEWSFTFNNSPEEVKNSARYLINHDNENAIIKALKIYSKEVGND